MPEKVTNTNWQKVNKKLQLSKMLAQRWKKRLMVKTSIMNGKPTKSLFGQLDRSGSHLTVLPGNSHKLGTDRHQKKGWKQSNSGWCSRCKLQAKFLKGIISILMVNFCAARNSVTKYAAKHISIVRIPLTSSYQLRSSLLKEKLEMRNYICLSKVMLVQRRCLLLSQASHSRFATSWKLKCGMMMALQDNLLSRSRFRSWATTSKPIYPGQPTTLTCSSSSSRPKHLTNKQVNSNKKKPEQLILSRWMSQLLTVQRSSPILRNRRK
jgi:hypothetical protein